MVSLGWTSENAKIDAASKIDVRDNPEKRLHNVIDAILSKLNSVRSTEWSNVRSGVAPDVIAKNTPTRSPAATYLKHIILDRFAMAMNFRRKRSSKNDYIYIYIYIHVYSSAWVCVYLLKGKLQFFSFLCYKTDCLTLKYVMYKNITVCCMRIYIYMNIHIQLHYISVPSVIWFTKKFIFLELRII